MAYASVDELKAQIGKQNDNLDPVIEAILEAATEAINNHCNRPDGFEAPALASARSYPGSGEDVVWIDDNVEVTLVEVKTSQYATTYVAWGATDWVAGRGDPQKPDFNRLPYQWIAALPTGSYQCFPKSKFPIVQVTARWGHAAAVPAVIKQACITHAARWFKRGEGAWADTIGNADMGIMQYRKSIDPDVDYMLVKGRMIRPSIG
jgi:hypothetical protein